MTDDLLDRILREVRERLEASRDAYEESRRLDEALAALGAATKSSPAPTSRSRRAQARSARAPRGEHLRRIREVVAERPGTSAGEIASAAGIARPTVASTLAKLARDGELEKTELPSGRVGYRVAREEPAADISAPSQPTSASAVESAPAREP